MVQAEPQRVKQSAQTDQLTTIEREEFGWASTPCVSYPSLRLWYDILSGGTASASLMCKHIPFHQIPV